MPALTINIMRQMWPRGNSKVPGLLEGIVDASARIFNKYHIINDQLVAHVMAQFSHECGAGTEMVENINYSPERAVQVWPRRFADVDDVYRTIGSYPGDPDFHGKLIDSVYGTRMGNRPGTHDGRTYIGRGLPQTTGREGYEKLGRAMGLDLLAHPEWVLDPRYALEAGVADFCICGCLSPATVDDVRGVTLRLNGGYVGLSERTAWLSRWKIALSQNPHVVSANPAMGKAIPPPPDIEPTPPPQPSSGMLAAFMNLFRRKPSP